ncbi:unnamed protein product [Prunus armeniaca]
MASTCLFDCGCVGDANDVFPYEVLDFSSGDCSKGFGFDPFCEVVHCDDCEFELSLALRHRAYEIQSLLCKRQGLTIGVRGSAGSFGHIGAIS